MTSKRETYQHKMYVITFPCIITCNKIGTYIKNHVRHHTRVISCIYKRRNLGLKCSRHFYEWRFNGLAELKLLTDMRIISSSTSFAAFSASNANTKKNVIRRRRFSSFWFFFGMSSLSCHVCRRENERNDSATRRRKKHQHNFFSLFSATSFCS